MKVNDIDLQRDSKKKNPKACTRSPRIKLSNV